MYIDDRSVTLKVIYLFWINRQHTEVIQNDITSHFNPDTLSRLMSANELFSYFNRAGALFMSEWLRTGAEFYLRHKSPVLYSDINLELVPMLRY